MKKKFAAFLLSAVCLLNVFAVSACGENLLMPIYIGRNRKNRSP